MENQTNIIANRKEILTGAFFREKTEYYDPENRKILGFSAQTRITGYETLNGAVKVNLKTVFRLLFEGENGTFIHDTAETEQVETITDAGIKPTSFICLTATVNDTSRMGSSLAATVEVSGWYIAENTVTLLNACIPGVHCKTAPFRAENVIGLCPGGLTLTYTDESRMNISSLLDYRTEATVTNVFCSIGSYRIEGEVYLRILAQGEEECFSQTFLHAFSTEVADERIETSSEVDVEVTVKTVDLSLAEGDKRLLITDLSLGFCGALREIEETEMVTDAYSEKNEITIKGEDAVINNMFCLRAFRDKISYKIEPENGINELIGFLCPAVSVSYVKNNGSISLEGVIETDMLYVSREERVSGQKASIPFKIDLPADYKCESNIQPQVLITGISAKNRNGEVDVLIEVLINIKGVSTEVVHVLSEMEIGGEKEENDFAVSLYIVRSGETLWDVAKALNVSEDTLLAQNPETNLPLSGGERIILFREL